MPLATENDKKIKNIDLTDLDDANFDSGHMKMVSEYCDRALSEIKAIETQLQTIINYKESNPHDAQHDDLMRRQVADGEKKLEKLKQFHSAVSGAADQVMPLCEKAHLLLNKNTTKTAGLGLGVSASSNGNSQHSEEK
jgi:hypothetical protein